MVTFIIRKNKPARGRIEWVLQETQQGASSFPLRSVFVLSSAKTSGMMNQSAHERSEVLLTWDTAQQVILAGLVVLTIRLVLGAPQAAGFHRGRLGSSRGSRGGQRIQVLESVRESCRMSHGEV